ncbi:MAG: hypothetical protein M1831_006609 [Alyxoria varia]|nr:MAG: hypothetical protein M1831_006609 [Alyxoria varia]
MMSHVYSKSYLQNSPSAAAVASALIYGRVLPKVGRFATSNAEVNVYTLFNSITMDFVTSYLFGLCNSSNFIENEADADWFLRIYEPRRKHAFWPQEMPKLTNALARIFPLTPAWVDDANRQFEDWCLKMCDAANEQLRKAAEKTGSDGKPDFEQHPENFPVVLQQLTNALNADASKEIAHGAGYDVPVRLKVASEALDHLSAGEETSAVTLTFLFYELAQRPELQERLRDEARSLQPSVAVDPPPSSSPDTAAAAAATKKQLPSAKALSNLPLLHAVLMETLRLHAAIPGPQPRVTPRNRKTILGPFGDIPGDVRVSANAYSLHRNSDVFPEPEAWRPERWLDEEKDGGEAERERMRWFWAFGSGGRMCIGSNFAMQTMRAVTVALVGNFRCEMVDEAQRLEQEDAYTAHPIGHELLLRFVGW